MQEIKIKISTLTGKLKGFQAINTNTLSNEFCSKMRKTDAICKDCYSAAMLQGVRKNCEAPWQRNSELLSSRTLEKHELPTINAHSFRFHAHGELINATHFNNYINIARKNPYTTFALWTKRINLVKDFHIPDNLIMIYSNPRTDKVLTRIPKGFDKVFNASDTGHVEDGQTECTGLSCMDCMACYRKDNGHTIIVEKVK